MSKVIIDAEIGKKKTLFGKSNYYLFSNLNYNKIKLNKKKSNIEKLYS